MQTLLENICNLLVSAVGCGLGAYIGLSIHNELSRRKRLKEGKQLGLDKTLDELVTENQPNAVKFEDSAKTIKLSIGFGDWLERFLKKWGITEECDQLGLTQAYIDKHQLTFKELGAIILDNRHCDYKAEKYRVFANGKTGILTREQLIEANREIEAAAYSLKDSSYIVLHDNICRDVAEPWLFTLVGWEEKCEEEPSK